ncbi:MAG: tRNA (adenosine(37)-N6)-threonylcarbamoyltransferase complex transferase subunit TsaD [Alphaproteobacteria bacterium]|nr:tRNA (adenosine(37)-N6)-threonylcarbamoyltransferase complex transferase subunit TsaD [Alphaproteobacteria bacterium]
MHVLGIETSCDETAAAVVHAAPDGTARILANIVASQLDVHAPYGGVVPELAARAHVETLGPIIETALAEAGLAPGGLDAVAATAGPGLIGGVLVGLTAGKAFALARGLPFLGINHLEGHALSVRLIEPVAFPYLLLLVSGGHCQLLIVDGPGRYERLGTTMDDAAGEAFDKGAKLLGLPYPGGPAIERTARAGRAGAIALPRPLLGRPGADFSFSGLKTALRLALDAPEGAPAPRTADLAAGLQAAIADCLVDRTRNAMAMMRESRAAPAPALVVAGGVAANTLIRERLAGAASEAGFAFVAPPVALCTDNAAMIAWAGIERLRAGLAHDPDIAARPRWPLDDRAAPREITAGAKGARA